MESITIRNLPRGVKQKLRVRAAQHGRSMEAEARAILAREVEESRSETEGNEQPLEPKKEGPSRKADTARGLWKGRRSTDEIMELTRGEG